MMRKVWDCHLVNRDGLEKEILLQRKQIEQYLGTKCYENMEIHLFGRSFESKNEPKPLNGIESNMTNIMRDN